MRKKHKPDNACPCGSGMDYADCCGRYIDGEQSAPTALALMKSRYTAYARGAQAYLLATWHAGTRPQDLDLAAAPRPVWLGLEIIAAPPAAGDGASVEFVARYKLCGRAHRLHETSRFVFEQGRWFYLDGDVHPARKPAA
ncbi:MAG: SEC-C domain-containing protein [Rhodocyclaceae bacterium]|nr:SEC-C domain-containing protein [Rhodocyclaceae bacterium]MBX3669119.1 SEC-C domain-containing protein [Rhodocyclaceae bacterium]